MHQEYKRIIKEANKAVLFVHGIVGTPNHFKEFVKLVPDNISVYNILLDGHGKTVKDFSKTSMTKWINQVEKAVDELAKDHSQVYVVAHSLGTLLSIEQSVKNRKITKMFLLAVPLKVFLKPKTFVNSFRVYFNKIDPQNEEHVAVKTCYGIGNDKNLLHYLGWIPRFLELLSQIKKVRKMLDEIIVPTVAYQSKKDEMVSKKSKSLLSINENISVVELKNSEHCYYPKEDFSILKNDFINFIND